MLRCAISHAYRNVPHYKRIFDDLRISPGDIKSVDDLHKIPILTKEQVLAGYPHQITSRTFPLKSAFKSASSGTSGVRGTYLTDWATRDSNFALLYRSRSLFGYRPNHLEFRFSWWPQRSHRWFHRVGFQRWISTSIRDPPKDNVAKMLGSRPQSILGSPSYLNLMSTMIADRKNVDMEPILVLSTGEVMDAEMRDSISRAFNAPAVDMYGCAEQNFIATECPEEGNLHLNILNAIIEVSPDGGESAREERGEILITQLTNTVMPLIRYSLGDVGKIGEDECNCGRHGHILSKLEGRKDDLLRTMDGREIPGELARSAVTIPGIRGYMIFQEKVDHIVIKVISDDLNIGLREAIIGEIRRILGNPETMVDLIPVEKIEPDTSGKRRLVISKVNN